MVRLGQHFLKSKKIISEIVKAAELKPDDRVLEVGPGKGILTEALLKTGVKVIAVEKDAKLVKYLENKCKNSENLKIIHGDILKMKNSDLFKNLKLKIKNFKIVANIPYYITSRFLRNFLESKNQSKLMVLMLQKEVAKRIMARPPRMNLLALSVQVYGQPKIISYVSKKYFLPPPKVDSAIIKISHVSKNFFNKNIKEKSFFVLVKRGFSHKRKLLKNNLKIPGSVLKQCQIAENSRAQELSLEDWKKLYLFTRIRKCRSLDPKERRRPDKPR